MNSSEVISQLEGINASVIGSNEALCECLLRAELRSVQMRLDVPWISSVDCGDVDPNKLPEKEYVFDTTTNKLRKRRQSNRNVDVVDKQENENARFSESDTGAESQDSEVEELEVDKGTVDTLTDGKLRSVVHIPNTEVFPNSKCLGLEELSIQPSITPNNQSTQLGAIEKSSILKINVFKENKNLLEGVGKKVKVKPPLDMRNCFISPGKGVQPVWANHQLRLRRDDEEEDHLILGSKELNTAKQRSKKRDDEDYSDSRSRDNSVKSRHSERRSRDTYKHGIGSRHKPSEMRNKERRGSSSNEERKNGRDKRNSESRQRRVDQSSESERSTKRSEHSVDRKEQDRNRKEERYSRVDKRDRSHERRATRERSRNRSYERRSDRSRDRNVRTYKRTENSRGTRSRYYSSSESDSDFDRYREDERETSNRRSHRRLSSRRESRPRRSYSRERQRHRSTSRRNTRSEKMSCLRILREWNLKFTGDENNEDPERFLSRLDTCRRSANMTDNEILDTVACTFDKNTSRWYESVSDRISSWHDFKQAF